MKIPKLLALILAYLLLISCTTPSPYNASGIGYSCFKEPSLPLSHDKAEYYLCVFELNTFSPYYRDETREKLLLEFVNSLSMECKMIREWEMTDPKAIADHSMFFINYRVRCS